MDLTSVLDFYICFCPGNYMQLTTSHTKQCPFCAETILSAAIKCRHCGEFLNTDRARGLLGINSRPDADNQDATGDLQLGEELYSGGPSLWLMTNAFVGGVVMLAIAGFLVFWHIEQIPALRISAENAPVVAKYRVLAGIGLAIVVVLVLAFKALNIKMTNYEVSTERIEFSEGIFDRRVDNLDMFRVVDMKLRRSLLDCIVGTGSVMLTTTDKSHPKFVFEKIRDSRELYDAIKAASLSADRKTNVIHME